MKQNINDKIIKALNEIGIDVSMIETKQDLGLAKFGLLPLKDIAFTIKGVLLNDESK